MNDKKREILDNFHNAMIQLSSANLLYHDNNSDSSVCALKTTKKYINRLIKEIKDIEKESDK